MVKQIDVRELAQRQAAGEAIYLLDVRQPWEHDLAALPDSQLIPLGELPARWEELRPPPGSLVVVYCHHGIRSMHAAHFLGQAGLAEVASLAGGIDAWSLEVDPQVPRY